MATPERTTREFSPEVAARRAAKAEREERLRSTALDSLDVGRGWSGPGRASDVVDAGIAEAVATTSERVALRTARGGREVQQAQRELAAKKAEVRGQQAAGKPKSKRPSIRERLEAMSESERDRVVASIRDPQVRAYVAGLRDDVNEVEQEAEYLAAVEREEATLATLKDDEPFDWSTATRAQEQTVVVDGVAWPADMTAEERQAVLDVAAVNAEPYYDSLEETYDLEDEAEEDE
jgi:hypothetical protein